MIHHFTDFPNILNMPDMVRDYILTIPKDAPVIGDFIVHEGCRYKISAIQDNTEVSKELNFPVVDVELEFDYLPKTYEQNQ